MIFESSTPTLSSDKPRERLISFPTPTSVLPNPMVGFSWSPIVVFFSVALLETPCAAFVEFTPVLSLTIWSFSVIAPVSPFIVTPTLSPSVIVHLLLSPLIATIFVASCVVFVIFPLSSNRFVSAGVYVTSNLSTVVSFAGVTVTSPFVAGVTVGAVGFTLTVTSIVLEGRFCVTFGWSVPLCDGGNVTFTLYVLTPGMLVSVFSTHS